MPREYADEIVEEGDSVLGERRSHPAYGVVQISRITGQTELFQSAFQHQHYIGLSISKAELVGTDHKHVFAREELVEVLMSETQFARAITAMNIGSGAPCTLSRFNGQSVPQIKHEDAKVQHAKMVGKKLAGILDEQRAAIEKIEEFRRNKKRPTLKELEALQGAVSRGVAHFEENMSYFASVFEEHVEQVVDEAKTEIEAHALHAANRLGLAQNEMPALATPTLESKRLTDGS